MSIPLNAPIHHVDQILELFGMYGTVLEFDGNASGTAMGFRTIEIPRDQ